jgi:hypothetical protein
MGVDVMGGNGMGDMERHRGDTWASGASGEERICT